VIFLAGSLKTTELLIAETNANWSVLISGATFSAISAYLCIVVFLKLLERIGMWPFVIYRLILGAILLWLFL
jgi:undecaprenyl-diphosphatase